ncbi:serine/threonine-protein kinase SBK1-like [Anomaloglossus baeobatrachus]|uniref:serine/threonine-protein kinase SBK1-like n=1 Tax=Anomaloglossus baeobatrachus TaxID=238106 RepID=UPI003F50B48D
MEATGSFELTKTSEKDFQILETLGSGTYGRVVMAMEKKTGTHVALKLMKKRKTKEQSFLHELCVSITLSGHEGIIFTHPIYVDSEYFYVLTQDLAPAGTLHSLIEPSVGIPEVMVKRCAVQLTSALEYMHDHSLVHRDLKPDNVLLMDKDCFHIKLSDFGLTQAIGTLVSSMSHIIPYMSPELCQLRSYEALVLRPSMDTWAFGVLLYVAFTGYFPWERAVKDDPLFKDFIKWQRYGNQTAPPGHWTKCSTKAQELFHALLAEDPTIRSPVTITMNYLHFPWGEDMPDNSLETVEDSVEVEYLDNKFIVIEGEDEYIVIEDRGDIECIIIADASVEAVSSSSNTVLVLSDNAELHLGSEVEIA